MGKWPRWGSYWTCIQQEEDRCKEEMAPAVWGLTVFEFVCRIFLFHLSSWKWNLIISGVQPGTHLDQKEKYIKYSDFVNKELILFSLADLQRSIPSMVDGLKPGQRKILFCSFKRNFIKEAKVAQFSGYVSEHSAYHHGEQSLASTILGMAQDFVGSNNINLLQPNGQFGTRNQVT